MSCSHVHPVAGRGSTSVGRSGPALLVLAVILAACSSTQGPLPAGLSAARTAQARLDQAEASRVAFEELRQLNRLVARSETAWEAGEEEAARRHAEEALATARLIQAQIEADRARAERDTVRQTIDRLRGEVGLGLDQTDTPGGTAAGGEVGQ